jgi:hypothetical protein
VGRHSPDEIVWLGTLSLRALDEILGEKAYLMADHPTGVDAIGVRGAGRDHDLVLRLAAAS